MRQDGEDFVGAVDCHATARFSACSGHRRNAGEAQRQEDQSQRILPGCGAFEREDGSEMHGIEVDQHDVAGSLAMEQKTLGFAVSDGIGPVGKIKSGA